MIENTMWHKSKAKIIYNPNRPGITSRTAWWVVANIINGNDICRYYRYQINKEILNPLGIEDISSPKKYKYYNLCEPSWGPHISVIRGEKPSNETMYLWKKYDGNIIDIEYSHYVKRVKNKNNYSKDAGEFWFVEIKSDFLINIRKELKKPYNWPLHMCVGRVWN